MGATTAPPRRLAPIVIASVFGGALVAALATWMLTRPVPAPPAPVERFVITTPAAASPSLTLPPSPLAVSPNGRRLVYRTLRGGANNLTDAVLYLRDLAQPEPTLIPGTEGAIAPFFSPDGEWIAFEDGVDNTLKRVPVLGGSPQTICTVDSQLRGGSWGADNTIIFATAGSKGLRRVPATGGEPQVLTKVDPVSGETDHLWPEVLPGGGGVLFTAWSGAPERSRIAAVSLSDGHVSTLLTGGTSPRFAPTGHLVFAVGGTMRAVRFDPALLAITGTSVPIVEGVAITAQGAAMFDMAADGTLVYVHGAAGIPPRTLVWVDRQGREEAIKAPPHGYTYARLSPDGNRVALDARDQPPDIWIWDLRRETLLRLTNDPGFNRQPAWTPDGARVAFTAERDGVVESIYWQAADGSGAPERLSVGSSAQSPMSFSPDGKRLVFMTPLDGAPGDLGMLSLNGERREEMLLKTPFDEGNGVVSPDGHWLAYESNESGAAEVYVRPFPDVTTSKRQVSTSGGTRPLWSKDGRELFYYVNPGTILAVPVMPGPSLALGKPTVVVKGSYAIPTNTGRHYDVSPDGKRFLLLKDVDAAGKVDPPEIRIVLHWFDELNRLVPAK